MLSNAQKTQITNWLTAGSFANIFSHAPGDGKLIADFLAATAGAGPTIVVLSVSGSAFGVPSNLPPQVIGGYNPQNWVSGGNQTPVNYQRTAFIFNLTSGTVRWQNLIGEGATDSGLYQTDAETGALGFKFGGQDGDIMVSSDLNEGWATNYSYGGTSNGPAITTGSAVPLTPPKDSFQVTQLDVYTFGRGSSTGGPGGHGGGPGHGGPGGPGRPGQRGKC